MRSVRPFLEVRALCAPTMLCAPTVWCNRCLGHHGGMEKMGKQDFGADFTWGVAHASYQVEGAWNRDGKGPSIWDTFTHGGGRVKGKATGDVACDFYDRFESDTDLVGTLGDPLPLGSSPGTSGPWRVDQPEHRRLVRGLRGLRGRSARRQGQELDGVQRAVFLPGRGPPPRIPRPRDPQRPQVPRSHTPREPEPGCSSPCPSLRGGGRQHRNQPYRYAHADRGRLPVASPGGCEHGRYRQPGLLGAQLRPRVPD